VKQQGKSGICVFAIVSPSDKLIYSCDLSASNAIRDDPPHLDELILYSSLDLVDRTMATSSDAYLKVVDRFNDFLVSAFVPISSTKFLLLHKHGSNDESIRIFFQEAYTLYTSLVANPAYSIGSVISQDSFVQKVRDLGRRLHT
jgi:trafficking protein particle complex subunit 2